MTEATAESVLAAAAPLDGALKTFAAFLSTSASVGLVLPFRRVQLCGVTMLVSRGDAAGISACCTSAVRSIQSWGLASIEQVVRQVRVLHRHSIDNRIARAVLSSLPRFAWLDQEAGWFWYLDRPNRLVRALGKVFSVTNAIKTDDLLAAVLRWYGFHQRPGRQVIESACAQLPGYRVDGQLVTTEAALDRHRWLSPTELSLVEMLDQNGGRAPVALLADFSRSWGIALTTLRMAIRQSPVVRLDQSHLVLIGTT